MLDSPKNAASPPAAPRGNSSNSLGLKGFNQVGSEEEHNEVLKPQGNPAHRRKTAALLGVVLILLGIIAALAFNRSHLSFLPESDTQEHRFGPSGGSSGGSEPSSTDQ